MKTEKSDLIEESELVDEEKKDKSSLQYFENSMESIKSSSISTSIQLRNVNDSAYSSFISQRNVFMHISNPTASSTNNGNKVDSPGTSYSSFHSGLINDEEMEEMFLNSGQFVPIDKSVEKPKESTFYFLRDLDYSPEVIAYRHSVRSSPWAVRPESAPLNEEDEDSDKEAHYSVSLTQEPAFMSGLPVTERYGRQSKIRRYSLMDESERRKDIIANTLCEIADKLNASKKSRSFSISQSSDNVKPSPRRRHLYSSFTDIVPCGCGSAIDLMLSLYHVYKSHIKVNAQSKAVPSSQSMANMNTVPPHTYSRSRSLTE